ncbi:septal ring lytic transglycosylase RlpA family protein [Parabacteroides distasonis]|nr:septal ring lytic transglycosylase RlpA family protein [Parabacteroides distasonis]
MPQLSVEKEYGHRRKDLLRITIIVSTAGNHPSGRVHDKEELVAAHRTYPFGTFLRVTNLENMKSTIVCVTDRGPRYRKRIIDVSASAAEILDFIDKGVAKVRIEVVPGPLDLRYLDLIYPKIPYLDIDYLRPDPPYRVKFTK